MIHKINPDTNQTLIQLIGIKSSKNLQLLCEKIEEIASDNKIKLLRQIAYSLFYPIKLSPKPQNLLDLALEKDQKQACEILLKIIATIQFKGIEINELAIKDIKFFKKLFTFQTFPLLLRSLQSKRRAIDVYESKIDESGLSFLHPKPFLTLEETEKLLGRIQSPNPESIKECLYLSTIHADFFFKPKAVAQFCSFLEKIPDDKILGNETLEIIIS